MGSNPAGIVGSLRVHPFVRRVECVEQSRGVQLFLAVLGAPPNAQVRPSAIDRVFQHDWPGNVRELEAVVRRALRDAQTQGSLPTLSLEVLPSPRLPHWQNTPFTLDPHETWDTLSARVLLQYAELLLRRHRSQAAAAKAAGIPPSTFSEMLKRARQQLAATGKHVSPQETGGASTGEENRLLGEPPR